MMTVEVELQIIRLGAEWERDVVVSLPGVTTAFDERGALVEDLSISGEQLARLGAEGDRFALGMTLRRSSDTRIPRTPLAAGRLMSQRLRSAFHRVMAYRRRAPLAVRIVERPDHDGHRWRRAIDLLLGAGRP